LKPAAPKPEVVVAPKQQKKEVPSPDNFAKRMETIMNPVTRANDNIYGPIAEILRSYDALIRENEQLRKQIKKLQG
jgi:cell shape-determining protein MreC